MLFNDRNELYFNKELSQFKIFILVLIILFIIIINFYFLFIQFKLL